MINMVFGLEELDQAYETEFEQKCREVQGYYSKPAERCTLDGEWTESELQADIYDVCVEVMTDNLLKRYNGRALRNKDLLKLQYMSEQIAGEIDVVETYNKAYDKNRSKNQFGIIFYDEAIKSIILKKLKENLVS